jgi:HAD superfamily hydrolase (TIGR01509 family)
MPRFDAIFFDQDGVIIDTERDGHRVAFNRTFEAFGIDAEWTPQGYHELLQIGGGKERMRHFFDQAGWPANAIDHDAYLRKLHAHKTQLFVEMIENRQLPLRPGVRRLMREAQAAGLKLGICTTSNERTATAIANGYLADIRFEFILAGDVVPRKKPDPAIYQTALDRSGVSPDRALVIEDSHIGVTAARAAGCHVVATANDYTRQEDLSAADVVLTSLGDEDEPATTLGDGSQFATGAVTLKTLEQV